MKKRYLIILVVCVLANGTAFAESQSGSASSSSSISSDGSKRVDTNADVVGRGYASAIAEIEENSLNTDLKSNTLYWINPEYLDKEFELPKEGWKEIFSETEVRAWTQKNSNFLKVCQWSKLTSSSIAIAGVSVENKTKIVMLYRILILDK